MTYPFYDERFIIATSGPGTQSLTPPGDHPDHERALRGRRFAKSVGSDFPYQLSIGELAIAERNRTGWLASGHDDAKLMTEYLKKIRGAVSIEQPMKDLGRWLKKP